MTERDIWLNKIDWFDIAVSGVIGGLTAGYGTAAKHGMELGKFGGFIIKDAKYIKAGEVLLTSAIDITGDGVQEVTFKQFIQRAFTGLLTMEVTNQVVGIINSNVRTNNTSFFDGTKYSDEVQRKMQFGDNHSFPEIIRNYEQFGTTSTIIGGDGKTYYKLTIPGYYNDSYGEFEFIKTIDGIITHRFFRPY